MSQILSNTSLRSNAVEALVPLLSTWTGSQISFDEAVLSCEDRLPGFSTRGARWAREIFKAQQQETVQGSGLEYRTLENDPLLLPRTATLVAFRQSVSYPQLQDYLTSRRSMLASVQVTLSFLSNNFSTSSYEVAGYDGSKVTVSDYRLKVPTVFASGDQAVIAGGAEIYDEGSRRPVLFGARTSPKGLDFFLPYTTGSGWKAGTLFLTETNHWETPMSGYPF